MFYLIVTGKVPGIAASNNATFSLTALEKSVAAPENSLEFEAICV